MKAKILFIRVEPLKPGCFQVRVELAPPHLGGGVRRRLGVGAQCKLKEKHKPRFQVESTAALFDPFSVSKFETGVLSS